MDTNELALIRAANEATLAAAEQFFVSQGRAPSRDGDCLRCELAIGGETYGIDYVVSAEFLLTLNEHPFDESGMDEYDLRDAHSQRKHYNHVFRRFQYELMRKDVEAAPRRELRLFVITAADAADETELIVERRIAVEADETVALKRVVSFDQFEDLQGNPFGERRPIPQAVSPSFDTVAELFYLKETAPAPTVVFSNRDVRNTFDTAEFASHGFAHIRKRITSILLRIAGPRHPVYAYANLAASGGDPDGTRFTFMSGGEHKIFSFALYLARLADSATPETLVGIYGTLNGLSLIWCVGVLGTLREFVAATGASVRLQAPHKDRRQYAQRVMTPVARIVDYRAIEI